MILTPLEAIVGIGMNAVSRRFEYEADRFACELQDKLKTEDAKDLSDRLGKALIAIHVKNLSTVWVDWLCVDIFLLVARCKLIILLLMLQILCLSPLSPNPHREAQSP